MNSNVVSGMWNVVSCIHLLLSTHCPPFSTKPFYLDTGLFQHLPCQGIRITVLIDHLLDACVDEHLRANNARVICTVQDGSPDFNPVVCSLDDRILLGMKAAAELVSFPRRDPLLLAKATDIQAVFQPGWSSVVTRGQNLLVFDEDSPYLSPQTGGPFGDEVSNVHEIFFPGGPMRRNLFFLSLFQG